MACELKGFVTHFPLRTAWIICAAFCATAFHVSAALAQVSVAITPTTGGGNLGTTVTQAGSAYQITGGTRPNNGPNLFHSFGEFGVPANNIANFLNDSGRATSNILSRVTGGNPSNIFGTIQTTGFGNANLFLMNPAGILFGPNATLNVGGSVHFTTADYLQLTDGIRFNAIPNAAADALLSTAPVAAFGFLSSSPAAISVQGSALSVLPGESISLVGGDISIQSGVLEDGTTQAAQLSASGGHIHLASVASPGEIVAGTLDYAPNVNGQSFGALGTIEVSQKSVIDASGDGGGTVLIRGGRFVIDDSRISANTTGPATGEFVGTPGEGIDIQVTQDTVIQNAAVLETNVTGDFVSGVGSGGVRIRADRIQIVGIPGSLETFGMQPFTGIKSHTQGAGNAGDIILTATGHIEITNVVNLESSSGFSSDGFTGSPTLATGNAGNVELTSTHGNILMTNGGRATVVTSQTLNSTGNTGKVTASAPEGDIVLDGANLFTHTQGSGGAGQVEITAKNLLMNASLFSQDNFGPFQPGGITVTVSGDLTMAGFSVILTSSVSPTGAQAADINLTAKDIVVTQGSLINSSTFASGSGGHLKIVADTLQIMDGSQVASGSTLALGFFPEANPTGPGGDVTIQGQAGPAGSVLIDGAGSGIFTNTVGTGAGGNTNLSAKTVTIQNGGIISAATTGTAPSATGGSIAISAGQSVTLNNGASITASSSGPGNAGNITINATDSFTMHNSTVTTSTIQSDGGNIAIKAGNLVQLGNSEITTNVQGGAGSGGNINIDPPTVILDHSKIIASAIGGNGGNINIVAGVFLVSPDSIIDASSTFGLSGTINIESPITNLSGTLAPLPQGFLQVIGLLQGRCAARVQSGLSSSLVVAGRDAVPLEPGDVLPGPIFSRAAKATVSRNEGPNFQMSQTFNETLTDDGLALTVPKGRC